MSAEVDAQLESLRGSIGPCACSPGESLAVDIFSVDYGRLQPESPTIIQDIRKLDARGQEEVGRDH